jgi:hypothetical protein
MVIPIATLVLIPPAYLRPEIGMIECLFGLTAAFPVVR